MTQVQQASPAPTMELGRYISQAWALVTKDLALFLVSSLIVFVVGGIPCVNLVILGPLLLGLVMIIQRKAKGEQPAIGDVFQGFQQFGRAFVAFLLLFLCSLALVVPLAVAAFVFGLIPVLGMLLFPVFIFLAIIAAQAIMYFTFVWPMMATSDCSPTEAVSKSFKFLFANFGSVALLTLVAALIGIAGGLACGIGSIFTMPLAMATIVIAYNEYYLPRSQAAA